MTSHWNELNNARRFEERKRSTVRDWSEGLNRRSIRPNTIGRRDGSGSGYRRLEPETSLINE